MRWAKYNDPTMKIQTVRHPTVKILKIQTPEKFAVIILKLKQYRFTTEYLVQKMQRDWKTV